MKFCFCYHQVIFTIKIGALMVAFFQFVSNLHKKVPKDYSEKVTKFCEIFTLLLSYVVPVKRFRKILWPSQIIWTLMHCSVWLWLDLWPKSKYAKEIIALYVLLMQFFDNFNSYPKFYQLVIQSIQESKCFPLNMFIFVQKAN